VKSSARLDSRDCDFEFFTVHEESSPSASVRFYVFFFSDFCLWNKILHMMLICMQLSWEIAIQIKIHRSAAAQPLSYKEWISYELKFMIPCILFFNKLNKQLFVSRANLKISAMLFHAKTTHTFNGWKTYTVVLLKMDNIPVYFPCFIRVQKLLCLKVKFNFSIPIFCLVVSKTTMKYPQFLNA